MSWVGETNKQIFLKSVLFDSLHYLEENAITVDVGGSITDDNREILSTYYVQRIVLWVGFNYVN